MPLFPLVVKPVSNDHEIVSGRRQNNPAGPSWTDGIRENTAPPSPAAGQMPSAARRRMRNSAACGDWIQ